MSTDFGPLFLDYGTLLAFVRFHLKRPNAVQSQYFENLPNVDDVFKQLVENEPLMERLEVLLELEIEFRDTFYSLEHDKFKLLNPAHWYRKHLVKKELARLDPIRKKAYADYELLRKLSINYPDKLYGINVSLLET